MPSDRKDVWAAGTLYEPYVGRWSRLVAKQFLAAPTYAMSLTEERRGELLERIRARLPIAKDGSIDLLARAWAVRGKA